LATRAVLVDGVGSAGAERVAHSAVVDDGGFGEADRARQRGRAWRGRGRRSHAWRGQRRKAGRLGWRGNRIGLKERVEIGGWGGAIKGKHIFVENVMRDEYAVGAEFKTTIPLVVRGVTEEETTGGARR
jgi:hypothetical protein